MLNKFYSQFDEVIGQYDAYKLETIGDAYFVVSGLPIRNEDRHAAEIATMSLHILSLISSFEIPHLPSTKVALRIGLHTGSCVAGVVGVKMPRYCLFGSAVNIAARMESTSLPFKIHCSPSVAVLLEDTASGLFNLKYRGPIHIKESGTIETYWLYGLDGIVPD